jgi:hypothetical protein
MSVYTVRLVGGLGNQLHGYAFGRSLEIKSKRIVHFDCDSGFDDDQYGRIFLLNLFPEIKIIKKNRSKYVYINKLHKYFLKFSTRLNQMLPLILKTVVVEPLPRKYRPKLLSNKYIFNPVFIGIWASFHYCNNIEKILRSELKPPLPKDESVLNYLKIIKKSKSCFIHYRSYKEEIGVFHPDMKNYYTKAIYKMLEYFPDITFYVFSDHCSAARIELSVLNIPLFFVELQNCSGNINSLNDFFLMYNCNHAIIGNSTFSWWAAWLSDNVNKIIIAPDGLSPWGSDWAPQNWIKIKC